MSRLGVLLGFEPVGCREARPQFSHKHRGRFIRAREDSRVGVPRVMRITGVFQPVDGQPPRAVETLTIFATCARFSTSGWPRSSVPPHG